MCNGGFSSSIRDLTGIGLRMFSLVLLSVYFILTLVYVLPVNPLRIVWQGIIDNTVARYFPQVWTLFGPNPASSNYVLLVRPVTAEKTAKTETGSTSGEKWFDLSTPLWERFQHDRFSGFDRLYRPQFNAMDDFLTGGAGLEPWREACIRGGDEQACRIFNQGVKIHRAIGAAVMARIGSSFMNRAFPGKRYVKMAIAIRIQDATPWSKRMKSPPPPGFKIVGIFPIDRSVTPAFFFSVTRPFGVK